MRTFWDASAVVPLLLREAHSERASSAWRSTASAFGWEWTRIEVEAALLRRQSPPSVWRQWRTLNAEFVYARLDPTEISSLLAMNRGLGLRAADAGHIFVFERLCSELPDMQLVTFDREMSGAVTQLGLALHAQSV